MALSPSSSSYPVSDHVEGRNEELVANESERVEHVEDAEGVQEDGAPLPLLLREQVRGEEGVVPAPVAVGGNLNAEKEDGEREGGMNDGDGEREGIREEGGVKPCRQPTVPSSETLAVSTISFGQRRCCHWEVVKRKSFRILTYSVINQRAVHNISSSIWSRRLNSDEEAVDSASGLIPPLPS